MIYVLEGNMMHRWARDLWPINRSLTGPGNRETLAYLRELLPGLAIHAEKSGNKVCDWTVPPEWVCHEAYIITPDGRRICDYHVNNLHLVGYSTAVDCTLTLPQLRKHLHSMSDMPEHIPYITSYYEPQWGFCLSHYDYESLPEGEYHVVIDSEHFDGELNYADMIITGKSDKEIILSTYICHPSMANNELSGPVVVTALARWLQQQDSLNYSYRIIFSPETIGALTYLCHHGDTLRQRVVAGYQVTTVGDDRSYSYIESPYADTVSDRVAIDTLDELGLDYKRYSYLHRGSDERQYCSPGIRLPIASLCRSKYAEYPEYHTSADNLVDVVTPAGLQGAFDLYRACIMKLESIKDIPLPAAREQKPGYPRTVCTGEPQLGRRNLYHSIGHFGNSPDTRLLTNLLSYCDGSNGLHDLARITGHTIERVRHGLDLLHQHELITEYVPNPVPEPE